MSLATCSTARPQILVDLVLRGATSLTVAEALAVLLQTWNRVYDRYRTFDQAHVTRIEQMVSTYRAAIAGYRTRAIDTLNCEERATIVRLFQTFEDVLGPVGASKALHLLAPGLFPLWDRAIAKAYALPLGKVGSNGDRYWRFMLVAQRQCADLHRQEPGGCEPLKSIDEYNYCKHTKGWL